MSIAIKQILVTEGWKEIKEYFLQEIKTSTNTRNIKESHAPEHIKLEVMSRNKASKIISRVLKKIDNIENSKKLSIDKVVYR